MEVLGLKVIFKLKRKKTVKLKSYIDTTQKTLGGAPLGERGMRSRAPTSTSSPSSLLLSVPQHSLKNRTHSLRFHIEETGPRHIKEICPRLQSKL